MNNPKLLAVVGSRRASAYGRQAADRLLPPVVGAGIPLISGLAYGIDALAHQACVDASQPTIAVLGSGLDDASIYPHRNRRLANQIIESGGTLISEYPPGTAPLAWHFPARNRIIATLAQATLVIQAAARSGSLITARLALESGRDVLAVPGPITDPMAAGTNRLIQQGATPILTPQDILDLYGITPPPTKSAPPPNLTKEQKQLITHLTTTPQHIDQLATKTNLPTPAISVTLIELELAGAVTNVGGMKYVKKEKS